MEKNMMETKEDLSKQCEFDLVEELHKFYFEQLDNLYIDVKQVILDAEYVFRRLKKTDYDSPAFDEFTYHILEAKKILDEYYLNNKYGEKHDGDKRSGKMETDRET